MASEVDIANRALSKLGDERITSLTDNNKGARAMLARLTHLRDAELEAHPWRFAIKRASLAALVAVPEYGYAYSYQRPADDLRPVAVGDFPVDHMALGVMYVGGRGYRAPAYEIVGTTIETDIAAPLKYEYVRRVTDTAIFSPLFVEALACRLAMDACEELTQSASKRDAAAMDYRTALREARRINALYRVPERRTPGQWLLSRI